MIMYIISQGFILDESKDSLILYISDKLYFKIFNMQLNLIYKPLKPTEATLQTFKKKKILG